MSRTLSKAELDFLEELDLYDKALNFTALLSLNQHDINSDGRGVRAMKIFTRQTLTAISLRKLFPRPSRSMDRDADTWDISSLASLTRNLMDGYVSLDYFGLEKISDSEADLRFQLLQLHRNIEWYNIRYKQLPSDELRQFEDGIAQQKQRILSHEYLNKLSTDRKKRALRFLEMYKHKVEFQAENSFCHDLVEHYRWLSNFVHPLPLSVERTDNERGRGLATDIDVNHCLSCLMLARRYLTVSAIAIADYFPERFAEPFKEMIDELRPLQLKGFEGLDK